ncbi:hypothetical protein I313_03299 [Cryptococcus deuterogattii Ram5]|uniref:Ras-GEF domain-containing protein n=1 Tax=Cryptococcus deuterogattii Ram5 TaxID=1296110 RepID=A0A0D0TXS1_9TREE|nr:hypothetical protein I313_03299 [Cryptococcus deuterogattii Ram5]
MLQPNAQQITLNQLSPPTPSELRKPITPSPTSTASFHTATVGTPKTLRRTHGCAGKLDRPVPRGMRVNVNSNHLIFGEIIALLFKHTFMAHLISDLILIQNGLLKATDPDVSWSMRSHDVASHSRASYRMNIMQISDEVADAKWGTALNMVMRMEPKAGKILLDIRPRDVFRHALGKEIGGPVGKSIDFFNHLSRWISTIVLASSKAKHRARVIERSIRIAHQLRRLNNYDSLYAVISGLREASVHRLSASHALVQLSPNAEKDYHSHLKLMDPRRGYIQYREAIQADIHNGRGAIPLLNNILGLVSQSQAVRPNDYREEDDKIQWDKFMRFGEILSIIQECQARGPMVHGNVDLGFKKIIEETTILSGEDISPLMERSQSLENSGGTIGGKMLKHFANLGF